MTQTQSSAKPLSSPLTILLLRGIARFDLLAKNKGLADWLSYFHNIRPALNAAFPDCVVHEPIVNWAGGVEERSAALKNFIDSTLPPDQPFHIIAHSMGGLD